MGYLIFSVFDLFKLWNSYIGFTLHSKSIDWFLYEDNTGIEWVKDCN